jgi:MFS family permease
LELAGRVNELGSSRRSSLVNRSLRTDWIGVVGLVACGAVIAFQVGKVPPSLPSARADLGLSLTQAGWTLSLISLLAATCGVAIGLAASSLGPARLALGGIVLGAIASLVSATANAPWQLLVLRGVEGVGFIAGLVALPTLIMRRTAVRDARLAMGFWSTYMPAGAATMMLIASAILTQGSWRVVWLIAGGSLLIAATILAAILFGRPLARIAAPIPRSSFAQNVATTARAPGPWLLGLCFGLYNGPWMIVAGFLPTLLVNAKGLTASQAAAATAVVAAANMVGNLSAGPLIARGAPRGPLIAVAAITMAGLAAGVFLEALPTGGRIASAILFSMVGGVIPGALFGAAPLLAPRPELLPAVNGMMLQGSNIGSVLAPPAAAALAEWAGWSAALWFIGASLVLSGLVGLALGAAERRCR